MEVSDEVLNELRAINGRLKRQNSLIHMLYAGIFYGVGFVIGSAVIASVIIGISAPLLKHAPWVQSVLQIGSSYIGAHR